MVAPMGAWEDGFAAGWAAGQRNAVQTGLGYTEPLPAVIRRFGRASGRKVPRAPSAYNKRLGRAIKRINKRAKKKDGDYRKGWTRAKVFKMAHKEAKRGG